MAVFIKSGKNRKTTVISNEVGEVLWVELKRIEIGVLLVTVVYLPPEGSLFGRKELMEDLERKLLGLGEKYDSIVLMGEFNTRTRDAQTENFVMEEEWEKEERDVKVRPRSSIQNKRGKKLINLGNLAILNGAVLNDEEGKFTFVSEMGQSLVDYLLVSQKIVKSVEKFVVED